MRLESPDERLRASKAVSSLARYRTAAKRLMIDALRCSYYAKGARPPEAFRADFIGLESPVGCLQEI
jgi:hypothetical protein